MSILHNRFHRGKNERKLPRITGMKSNFFIVKKTIVEWVLYKLVDALTAHCSRIETDVKDKI